MIKLKFIQANESFLKSNELGIKELVAQQDIIQVQFKCNSTLRRTDEYPDTEDNRIKLYSIYS